jgi:methionine-rich copper-binding protein CopC
MQHTTTRRPRTYREKLARRRRILAIAALAALLLAVVLETLSATGARAHAGIVTITPANGSVLPTAPSKIGIVFNEGVQTAANRVQLLDGTGKIVATKFALSGAGSSVTLTPAKKLPRGLYALRWSVVSADGHVITGASTFAVGARGKRGRPANLTVTGSARKSLVVRTTNGVGTKTFTVASTKVTGLELRHKRLGATLEIPVSAGKAAGILPYPGEWTITVIERTSTYTEERYTGKLVLK